MADITTPATARKTEEFTTTQIELVRNSLAIADNPILPNRTYIVFDAISGNNNLHLDVGGSTSYTINKGEGGLPANYTDTGGVKVLNYTNAGRYLITISGTFNGIDTDGAIQADKDKYISIISGSNYPTTIPINAFNAATNLDVISFPLVTNIGNAAIRDSGIKIADFPLVTSIGDGSFNGCAKLKEINFPLVTNIGANAFNNCVKLKEINFPLVTSIDSLAFTGCVSLVNILLNYTLTLISGIGVNAFNNVVIHDLFVNSATFTEALSLLTAMQDAGIALVSNFRLLYGSDAGGYIIGSLKVSKDGNPQISFENTGDNSLLRAINVDFEYGDGVGFTCRSERDASDAFTDVILNFISGAGNTALLMLPDGTLQALITYTKTVGATNKPLYIDDSGNIGVEDPSYGFKTIDIGDWDMDTDSSKNVNHGLTLSKIRDVSIMIRQDDTLQSIPLITAGSVSLINATLITLFRIAADTFDSPAFDSTSFNRGWITIRYEL